MLISRGRNPSAAEVVTQLVTNPELRGRVLTTLGLLLLIRLGIYIPLPGIDREAFQSYLQQGGQLIGFLDIFTGGGISTLGVFALGILPFINASIISLNNSSPNKAIYYLRPNIDKFEKNYSANYLLGTS